MLQVCSSASKSVKIDREM